MYLLAPVGEELLRLYNVPSDGPNLGTRKPVKLQNETASRARLPQAESWESGWLGRAPVGTELPPRGF